jgi:hypothetical protein
MIIMENNSKDDTEECSLEDLIQERNGVQQPDWMHESMASDDSWADPENDAPLAPISTKVTKAASHYEHPSSGSWGQEKVNRRRSTNDGNEKKTIRRSSWQRSQSQDIRSSWSSQSFRLDLSDEIVEYVENLPDENLQPRNLSPKLLSNKKPNYLASDNTESSSSWMPQKSFSSRSWNVLDCSGSEGDDVSLSYPNDLKSLEKRRPRMSLHKEQLLDGVARFSFHTPRCVMEDLTSVELESCSDMIKSGDDMLSLSRNSVKSIQSLDDDSMSSLSDDDTKSSDSKISLKQKWVMKETMLNLPVYSGQTNPKNILKMPHTTVKECALVFVDISGFTKLSTILDEESLSKVIVSLFCLQILISF